MTVQPIINVQGLVTEFSTDGGRVTAVDNVSFKIQRGRTLGLVGESGCGKSVTSLSVMGLLPKGTGFVSQGTIEFEGRNITTLNPREFSNLRGNRMAMIFQEPMTALNPVFTIGNQIIEIFMTHRRLSHIEARERSIAMLKKVRIPDPDRRMDEYPHQMSGGMKQRIMIAMALACDPALVVADEPTTALDVTIQAQILRLLKELQKEFGTAILFITHDLGVIAEMADDVAVMYAGQIVEIGSVMDVFDRAAHPYTQGLHRSIPKAGQTRAEFLPTIAGLVPTLKNLPAGCRFAERCPKKQDICIAKKPELRFFGKEHQVACHFPEIISRVDEVMI